MLVHMPDAAQWDGKIHRRAKAGEGFRWGTADGAQRCPASVPRMAASPMAYMASPVLSRTLIASGDRTQTSAVTPTINQCIPAPGFVNNPCFQNIIMTLSEGRTHYSHYRESSTDSVATAGLVDDVTATIPQHGIAQRGFEDTRIAPVNGPPSATPI
jgi:hypothetical protein